MPPTSLALGPLVPRGPCPVCHGSALGAIRIRCPRCAVELDRECFGLVERCPTYGCLGLDGFAGATPPPRPRPRPIPRVVPKAVVPAAGVALGLAGLAAGGLELLGAAVSWLVWLVTLPFQVAAYVFASEPWMAFELLLNLLALLL